jgi:hypothetical protein
MKKLFGQDTNEESGDARYRARITEQQKQHIEELKKLQQSLQEKSSEKSLKDSQKDTEKNETSSAVKDKLKEVNVSKKKNIFKIITDTFVLAVQPKRWKEIILGLKVLFSISSQEDILIEEIKNGNKKISAYLAVLKKKDLDMEIKIAQLLRQIELGSTKIPLANLTRVCSIQNELATQLNKISSQKERLAEQGSITQVKKGILHTISQEQLSRAKDIATVLTTKANTTARDITTTQGQNLNQQHQFYIINNNSLSSLHQNLQINILKPIEQIALVAKDITQKLVLEPVKNLAMCVIADLQNIFNPIQTGNYGDRNCKNYNQGRQSNVFYNIGIGQSVGCSNNRQESSMTMLQIIQRQTYYKSTDATATYLSQEINITLIYQSARQQEA